MNIIDITSQKVLVGLEIRTKNSDEFSENGKIHKLWEMFYQDNLHGKVKKEFSKNIYGIYSNYESDHTGEYDYFIGFEVHDIKPYENHGKLVIKKIEQGKYSIITTEKGPAQKVIAAAWEKIWKMNVSDLGGSRLFKTDYEIYTAGSNDPDGAIFNIYLGIKS